MSEFEKLVDLMFKVIELNDTILCNSIYQSYLKANGRYLSEILDMEDVQVPHDMELFYDDLCDDYDASNMEVIKFLEKRMIVMNIKSSILEERLDNIIEDN